MFPLTGDSLEFRLVRWDALLETVGAMFALTFFSLLHVPINVPALAQSIGEDNADLNHELKLHGYSNLLSGLVGSIQNYLVYANSLFFMRSGGDRRLAGFLLAGCTAIVMFTGGSMIGYIPVMMVGTLIFSLGFELLEDALARPRRKLELLEYLTVREADYPLIIHFAYLSARTDCHHCPCHGYLRLCCRHIPGAHLGLHICGYLPVKSLNHSSYVYRSSSWLDRPTQPKPIQLPPTSWPTDLHYQAQRKPFLWDDCRPPREDPRINR
jgi:hypothetical protein